VPLHVLKAGKLTRADLALELLWSEFHIHSSFAAFAGAKWLAQIWGVLEKILEKQVGQPLALPTTTRNFAIHTSTHPKLKHGSPICVGMSCLTRSGFSGVVKRSIDVHDVILS
jgi:hypothetical protein